MAAGSNVRFGSLWAGSRDCITPSWCWSLDLNRAGFRDGRVLEIAPPANAAARGDAPPRLVYRSTGAP